MEYQGIKEQLGNVQLTYQRLKEQLGNVQLTYQRIKEQLGTVQLTHQRLQEQLDSTDFRSSYSSIQDYSVGDTELEQLNEISS